MLVDEFNMLRHFRLICAKVYIQTKVLNEFSKTKFPKPIHYITALFSMVGNSGNNDCTHFISIQFQNIRCIGNLSCTITEIIPGKCGPSVFSRSSGQSQIPPLRSLRIFGFSLYRLFVAASERF